MRCIAFVMGLRARAGGTVHLAAFVKVVPVDLILRNGVAREGYGLAIEADHCAIIAAACVIIRCQIMRQIDHKARVATGCTIGDLAGLENGDTRARDQLRQAPCGRQSCKATADDHEIRSTRLAQYGGGWSRAKNRVPGRRAKLDRQPFGFERHQSTASSSSSARSIQMVFNWVY